MSYVEYGLPAVYWDNLGDPFGSTIGRTHPHLGQDIAPVGGGGVFAIADGELVYDWYGGCLGNVAVLRHADGMFSGYAHLAAQSPLFIGTPVRRGETIAQIGDTGSCSLGRHLHLTIATSMAGAAGGFDVIDPIVYIRAHGPAPVPVKPPSSTAGLPSTRIDPGWRWGLPNKTTRLRIQKGLRNRGRYAGLIDGIWGPRTIKAIQMSLIGVGYHGLLDGTPGPATCHYVQMYAKKFGDYRGGIDNKLGTYSWLGFALGLERR